MSGATRSERVPSPASERVPRAAADARAHEVARGVWSLKLPLCYVPMSSVNAYLLAVDDGWLLWDCGSMLPPAWDALAYAITQAGAAPVTTLVISHAHADHRGLAAEVVARTGARLLTSQGPHPLIDSLRDADVTLEQRYARSRREGVPEAAVAVMAGDLPGDDPGYPRAEAVAELAPGAELETASGTWEVVALPGHSADQIGLHNARLKMLISADLAFPGLPSYLEYGTRPDPHADQLASLERAIALEPELLLPGHGKPIPDAVDALHGCRELVTARVGQVLSALSGGDVTGWDVACALTPLDGAADYYQRSLAEGLSVLEHLESEGAVTSRADAAGVRRWRAA